MEFASWLPVCPTLGKIEQVKQMHVTQPQQSHDLRRNCVAVVTFCVMAIGKNISVLHRRLTPFW